jgi:HlyD family secretion protein
MPRRRTTLGALGLALGAAVALVYWLTRAEAVPVRLATIDRGVVEATVANTRAGTVKACQRARISPAVGGRIDVLPVHEGDRVARGDLLLELWNDDVEARLELAEREHAAAQARGEQACVRADVAEEEAARQVALQRQGITAVEGMRRTVAEGKALRAGCRAAAEATRVAEAQVAVTQAALAQTRLRAPFAGIVAEINGELGEFVTPSPVGIPTPPTVDLIDTSCPYVSAPIDEVDAGSIRTDMVVRITLDAFGDQHFAGRVRRVAPYVLDLEAQARTVDVEADFVAPDQTRPLLIGYSADIEVILDRRDDVVRVPTEALLEGHRVLVYVDGRLEERTVEPGLSNWRNTEVRSGLGEGERVVLSVDREGVEVGARVRPDDASDEP